MPFPGSAPDAVMAVRAGAAGLVATTLILAGIVLAARPAGRTSRTATWVLRAIPVVSAALSVVAVVSGSPDLLAFILLLSCAAVILALTRAQARRLSRHMKAAQDSLRRARLNRQQRRLTPPGSPPPAQAAGRPEGRPGPR
jgi:heme A synthase